jgi:hypothetical protein
MERESEVVTRKSEATVIRPGETALSANPPSAGLPYCNQWQSALLEALEIEPLSEEELSDHKDHTYALPGYSCHI